MKLHFLRETPHGIPEDQRLLHVQYNCLRLSGFCNSLQKNGSQKFFINMADHPILACSLQQKSFWIFLKHPGFTCFPLKSRGNFCNLSCWLQSKLPSFYLAILYQIDLFSLKADVFSGNILKNKAALFKPKTISAAYPESKNFSFFFLSILLLMMSLLFHFHHTVSFNLKHSDIFVTIHLITWNL